MGRLSTHVLDLAHGRAAAAMTVEVLRVREGARESVAVSQTNAQGRTDQPLVSGDRLEVGTYELVFHVGAYFKALGVALSEPPFLDQVIVRVGLADADGSYHVPLLVSPYGYSTYRGT
jgi:5-hydroxyisourate hydrolase